MNKINDFSNLLCNAKAGEVDAVEEIIAMYMPLINKHSRINGTIDEDLKQTILLKIISSLKKFKM